MNKLSDICFGITDGSYNPPKSGEKSKYLMLSSKNVYDDLITFEDPRYLSEEQFVSENRRTDIKPGDVLMTIVGTVGRTAVVGAGTLPITLQRSVAVLHPNTDICSSRYLMYLLRSKRSFFEAEAHGVAQKGIYLKQLSDVKVAIPGLEKQNEVVTILDKISEVLRAREAEIAALDELIKARFITAKRIEGCSDRTISYYQATVDHFLETIQDPIRKISTEMIRTYLMDYQTRNGCSNTTIDNIRRNISSFFTWLEEEDYILKSPMRRIHKIKARQPVKDIISDESIEKLRDACGTPRDLAIIDLLYSTGMRVGELVRLNKNDIDFENRECIVFGKGNKERKVYFDAKTKIHLQNYLNQRDDDNEALLVTLDAPHDRLKISGIETRLRLLGNRLGIGRIHPHKFRRTMATRAIDRGMPIEQVQKILGHSQIDTTMQYAIVNQNNVKTSHQKYIA